MVFHGDFLLFGEFAGHLLKLFDAGKLVDVFEAEAEEEVLGGFVEDGAADDLFAAGGGDELARDEGAEDAAGVDAADLGDLGGGDGLLVGDDGEGFEGLEGELQGRLEGFDEAADGVVVLGLGGEAVAAGDLADLEAAVGGGVVGDELVEDGAEVVAEGGRAPFPWFRGLASFRLCLRAGRGLRFPALVRGRWRVRRWARVIGSSRVSLVRMAAASATACWWAALSGRPLRRRRCAERGRERRRARLRLRQRLRMCGFVRSRASDCWEASRWSSSAWASWPRRPMSWARVTGSSDA